MLFLASFLPFPFPQPSFFLVPSGLYFLHFFKSVQGDPRVTVYIKGEAKEKNWSASQSVPLSKLHKGRALLLPLAEGEGSPTPWRADSKSSQAQIPLQPTFPTLPDHYVKQQEHFTPEPAAKGTTGLMFKCWSITSATRQVLLWALNALLSVPASPGSLSGQRSATPAYVLLRSKSPPVTPHTK